MARFEKTLSFDGTTAETVTDIVKLHKEWDKELNTVYKKLISEIEGMEKEYGEQYAGLKDALIKSQRSWIQYRE